MLLSIWGRCAILPPTNSTDALRLINNMHSYYKNALDQFVEDDLFYNGELESVMELPEGFEPTIPTTARAIIDEAVDNVEPYDMYIRYAPRSFGKQAQLDAETVSRFLKNIWLYWRQKNSDTDILRDFIKNLFKHGKAVMKVVPDWSLWPSLDETEEGKLYEEGGKVAVKERAELIKQLRKENFPIVARNLSPRHVIEDPTMDARKLWAIEFYETSISEIRNRYAKFEPVLDLPEPYNYTVKELWTATYVDDNGRVIPGRHWIFINETCVNGENGESNPYHDIPYIIKHSGFGSEAYDGKPERKAVGFFTRQVKSMLKAEIRRVTHFDAMMQQLAFPIVMLPEAMEDSFDFDTAPGAINYVPEEVIAQSDKIYLQASLPDAAYMQSINMIQNQIERGTTQRAIRGAGVPGTDSAAQLSMITAQAKLRLEPIKRASEEAVDMVNFLTLRFINEILGDSVSVFGAEPDGPDNYTLKPEHIKGRYRTRTTFMPNEEQIKERKLVLVTDAMAKAKLNPYDAYTFAGWENPMEVIGRNLAYSIMEEPAIRRQIAKQFLKDWGLDATEIEIEEMNDNATVQQLLKQLQVNNAGIGQQPGSQMMAESSKPPSQPQRGGGPSAAPPQAAGSPLQMPNQMPQVNDMNRMMGQANGQ